MAAIFTGIKMLPDIGAVRPDAKDPREELPGYRPKPKLFPDGRKSPYVREKASGVIWHYQHFMDDMGDVLEPCWEAPPKPGVMIATSPLDIAAYAEQPPKKKRGRPAKNAAKQAMPKSALSALDHVSLDVSSTDDANAGAGTS